MMAIIIISVFAGVPALSILALPVFLSAMLGFTFDFKSMRNKSFRSSKTKVATPKKVELAA